MQEKVVKCAKKNKWITNESLSLVQISTAFPLQIRNQTARRYATEQRLLLQ
jgi:hypothetical protein